MHQANPPEPPSAPADGHPGAMRGPHSRLSRPALSGAEGSFALRPRIGRASLQDALSAATRSLCQRALHLEDDRRGEHPRHQHRLDGLRIRF